MDAGIDHPRTRKETGATAVEYGVLIALVIAVVIGTVAVLGQDLLTALSSFATEFAALVNP